MNSICGMTLIMPESNFNSSLNEAHIFDKTYIKGSQNLDKNDNEVNGNWNGLVPKFFRIPAFYVPQKKKKVIFWVDYPFEGAFSNLIFLIKKTPVTSVT